MRPRMFDETVVPHLDAAFNYARWLTRNDAEAEDVVQDACVRAMRFFSSFRHDNARAWLFTIVRNTWFSRLNQVLRTMVNSQARALSWRKDEKNRIARTQASWTTSSASASFLVSHRA